MGHGLRSSAITEELIAVGKDLIFVDQITGLTWVKQRTASLGFTHVSTDSNGFKSNPDSDVFILDSYEIDKSDAFIAQQNRYRVIAIVDEMTPILLSIVFRGVSIVILIYAL